MERKIALQEGLPFLYGWKWYKWAKEFFESKNKLNFLCAANQISKSSTQIRKAIDWATNKERWPELWPHLHKAGQRPRQFWYLYPTREVASIEFEQKWRQFLPANEFKDDERYGWKHVIKNKEIFSIEFKSGVTIYFKAYSQDTQHLQTGTCDAIFCDEELPIEHYEELMFRLSASDGYFHMVFTATLGQDFWRQVIDPLPDEEEALPHAAKWVVSMFECMTYEDGTPSHWTEAKINQAIARCSTHNEVLKRVYGRFVMEGGRKYPQFDIKRHVREPKELPPGWLVYAGLDYGSGGPKGHPSAIVFVGVHPDMRQARVFLGWRGDGVETTAGDLVQKYIELRTLHKLDVVAAFYDYSSKDMQTIASRMNEPLQKAEKHHEVGEQVLNTLFKHDMLTIDNTEELSKLAREIASLRKDTDKRKAKDDFADALRYAVVKIPFDFSMITGEKPAGWKAPEPKKTPMQLQLEERRRAFDEERMEYDRVEEEFAEANELYGF